MPYPDFWDADTWKAQRMLRPVNAAGIPLAPISTIRCQLGRVPVLPDLQPESDRAEQESHARREAIARAGFCGDCGDSFS